MKNATLIALVTVAAAATLAFSNSYEGTRYATTEGKVYTHLSGEFQIAASTASASTHTIRMNGNLGRITVSTTSVYSGETMCIAGAHAALPTSGYPRGCLLYLTTDPTKIYISTETVVGTRSWLGK